MATRLNPCDPDRLRLLAEGHLDPTQLVELEEHLHDCPTCQASLDRLADSDRWLGAMRHYLGEEATRGPETPAPTEGQLDFLGPSDWPDSLGRIGPYEVKGVLGRGGMGVVLKALDSALNRNVAIKVLAAHLATSGPARQRFLREARAAAAVVHEHVAAVHSVAEASGLPYIVMEYVPGRSLQERLDAQGPLALAEVLRIGMQAAAGLAAAHAQGLVHRDVKPANILLENGVERVRLTDFGLARAAAEAVVTQSGVVVGTPHYMAPEQARGEAVDHRADLFSLGSTLYAACTGHPPFRAEKALAVIRRVCDDEPRAIREMNPEVPDWLAGIIGRLLAKQPDQRFQTAAEVADLLGRCLAHVQQPLVVPLPEGLRRTERGWSRFLLRALPFALAASLLVAGVFLFRPRQQPTSGATDEATPAANRRPASATGAMARGTDEIDEGIRAAWSQARMVEVDLCRACDPGAQDVLSANIHGLEEDIRRLEREIVSVPGAGTAAGGLSLGSAKGR
jgi:serine/threonine protein kinase